MSQKGKKNYILQLTGLRALAAFLVFIHHFNYIISAGFSHPVQRYLKEFNIGLPIFFSLAGFSIAYRYFDKFSLTADWFKPYLKNRIARIFPMYFLLTVVAFVYYHFNRQESIVGGIGHPFTVFLLNITFLRGFFDQFKFTGIGQGWSLTVNICFYIVAPFAFFIIKKWKVVYIQPFIITGFGFLLVLVFSNFNWYGFFGNFTYMMLYSFFGRCLELFGGIWVAMYVKKNGFGRSDNIKLTYIGFLVIMVCVYMLSKLDIVPGQEYALQSRYGIIINNYIIAPAAILFLYGIITEYTVVQKLLSTRLFITLGKSSYVFYLIHLGLINDWLHIAVNRLNDKTFELYDKMGVDWHSPFEYDRLNLLYIFIVLNFISVLLYKFIEEPVNQVIRKSKFWAPQKMVVTQMETAEG